MKITGFFNHLALISCFSLGLGFSFLPSASAKTFVINGHCEFIAVGKPSALKIHGQGDGLTGKVLVDGIKVSGNLKFPLKSFTTGVDLRDKHMKDKYLETEKYPEARLVIDDFQTSKTPENPGFEQNHIPFKGTLTLHGISNAITGTADLKNSSDQISGGAQFDLKISDYKITVPQYLGITMADSVQVTVHFVSKMSAANQ